MKTLIWVQHLLGMGHLMRAAALARALADQGADTLLVSGGPVSDLVNIGRARLATLPPCRAADVSFKTLLDENDDIVTDDWWDARISQFHALVDESNPDAIVTETFPFGRKKFRNELLPIIQRRRNGPKPTRIIASVRDILVSTKAEKEDWMVEIATRDYDDVLVHGDPDIVRLEDSFHNTPKIRHLMAYTGYIVSAEPATNSELEHQPEERMRSSQRNTRQNKDLGHYPVSGETETALNGDGKDEVIISCGSGAVGQSLLHAAVEGRALSKRASDLQWRILAGYGIGEDVFAAIRDKAPPGIIVERARPDFIAMLRRARLAINQGGYNTVMDVVSTCVPCVVVPISAKGETEQEQRADLMAAKDLLVCLPERDLTAATLADAVDRALALDPPEHGIDINGVETSAQMIIERIRQQQISA